jgi:hypothetical protein
MNPKAIVVPKGWPKDSNVSFISNPVCSSAVTKEHRLALSSPPTNTPVISNPVSPAYLVGIKAITKASHPANGQHGLFAARNLLPGSLILLYLGLFHGVSDTDPSSSYDLNLDSELGIGIDAQKMGNEARFINDYRGVADRPNAEFRDVWVRMSKDTIERRIGVFVLSGKGREKGIRKGDEILVSYGKGFWKGRMQQTSEIDEGAVDA